MTNILTKFAQSGSHAIMSDLPSLKVSRPILNFDSHEHLYEYEESLNFEENSRMIALSTLQMESVGKMEQAKNLLLDAYNKKPGFKSLQFRGLLRNCIVTNDTRLHEKFLPNLTSNALDLKCWMECPEDLRTDLLSVALQTKNVKNIANLVTQNLEMLFPAADNYKLAILLLAKNAGLYVKLEALLSNLKVTSADHIFSSAILARKDAKLGIATTAETHLTLILKITKEKCSHPILIVDAIRIFQHLPRDNITNAQHTLLKAACEQVAQIAREDEMLTGSALFYVGVLLANQKPKESLIYLRRAYSIYEKNLEQGNSKLIQLSKRIESAESGKPYLKNFIKPLMSVLRIGFIRKILGKIRFLINKVF